MKVAIYCRLSREDEDKLHENDESESIQNQKSMLINYSIERKWDIYKIYCDEDYSGIDSQRPEFNELIQDAQNHKFDIVLCKTQSRFTRDMELVEKYLHNKFIEWNIRFVSLVDHVDTQDKGNKKSRSIPLSQRIIVENTHEPIIEKEQFWKIQRLFKSKARTCKTGEVHIFANKLICLDCKAKLYKCQNSKGYVYFSCSNSRTSIKICSRHSIGYENLENLITQKIKEKINDYFDFENIDNKLFEENTIDSENLQSAIKQKDKMEKDISILLDAIKNLYIDKAKGNITEDLFAELNNSFLNDKEEKENRLNYLKIKISNIEREKEDIGEIANKKQNIIDKLKNLNTINFDIVNSFIDYIEIGDKFNNTQDIVIHWNF